MTCGSSTYPRDLAGIRSAVNALFAHRRPESTPLPRNAGLTLSSAGGPSARLFVEHDLFRKPVSTPDQVRGRLFRDHALVTLRTQSGLLLLQLSLQKLDL